MRIRTVGRSSCCLRQLYGTREALVADIVGNMPDHRRFLLGFEKGEPDWDLLEVPHAKTLPAILWKLHNFAKVSDEKRTHLVARLEAVLGMGGDPATGRECRRARVGEAD